MDIFHNNSVTVRDAYYLPAYYEYSLIINQAKGPDNIIPIAFVLYEFRWSINIMHKPLDIITYDHNKQPWL